MTTLKIQNSFEDAADLANWQATGDGALELSSRHAKDGRQALCWTWADQSQLGCGGLGLDAGAAASGGIEGWVYLEKPHEGRLTFRLGAAAQIAAGEAPYVFRFGLNFTGWRMFRVSFERDCRAQAAADDTSGNAPRPPAIECLEIVPPAESPEGTLWLDALVIGNGVSTQRSADYQVPEHADGLGGWCEHQPLHYARLQPSAPLPERVTDTQTRDLSTIRARYFQWLTGTEGYLDTEVDAASPLQQRTREQIHKYIAAGWATYRDLNFQVDAQGCIQGPPLHGGRGAHTFHHVSYDALVPLALDWRLNGNEAAREAAFQLFDYMHDQGWAEGSALGDLWLNPLLIAAYCHAVALMHDDLAATGRLAHALGAAKWYQTFGKIYEQFDASYIETNADALRTILLTTLVTILLMEDGPEKVRAIRAWLVWFNDALKISPRFTGLIKPDGLGFHHQGVYASAYATEAYEVCALLVWLLHDTGFAPEDATTENLRLALRTHDQISNKYDVPYATMGRMPGLGCRVFSAYAYMALAADDDEMAGIFMRLWDPELAHLRETMRVDLDGAGGKFIFLQTPGRLQILEELVSQGRPATPPPQGFFAKPWGGLAIQRRDDWMLAVKGWSQYVWDFEMHPGLWGWSQENVYARYISYGTLQPVTHGNPINPLDSGWNLGRGWDWCRWPGATTKHLTLAENYDPKSSWANRFFSTATFVGAVACEGRNGMFALKLHEHFHDPSFRAFKTYFFLDDLVVCLGSNLECRDDDHALETTLFQSWMPDRAMPVEVNGAAVRDFPFQFQGEPDQALTLRDPYGHGYYLPDGGSVRLERSVQHSRDAWNRGDTEGDFSTAWIDHGHGPREDGYGGVRYHYAMLVNAAPERLAGLAAQPPYSVLQQNHQAHTVETMPAPLADAPSGGTVGAEPEGRIMAYALFEADRIVSHGIVRKTDTPVLVMTKESAAGLVLSLADPDLRLPKRRNVGYLDDEANGTVARTAHVRLELRGAWQLADAVDDVSVEAANAERTTLRFTCRHGATSEVRLMAITPTH